MKFVHREDQQYFSPLVESRDSGRDEVALISPEKLDG